MANFDPGDVMVMIPYKTLVGLLEAPKRVEELEKMLRAQSKTLGALRGQFIELIDKIAELEQS